MNPRKKSFRPRGIHPLAAAAIALLPALGIPASCASPEALAVAGREDTMVIPAPQPVPVVALAEDRGLTSMELARSIALGWNLGNTLDVCAADRNGDGKLDEHPGEGKEVDETLWGNIITQPELFDALKAEGFDAVRIPVTWRDHMDAANRVSPAWMDRVRQVVDMALERNMTVLINVHHDGGDDAEFGAWVRAASDDWDTFLSRYRALWTQIADRFADCGDRLVFESLNEVGFNDLDKDDAFALLNRINQEFVDLVRSRGPNNARRHLLISGYWTDIEETTSLRFHMPEDPAGRLLLSLHYYTPWQFCITNQQYKWGSDQDDRTMAYKLKIMKNSFLDQGIPVMIGEYGTFVGNDAASRIAFCKSFVERCHALGVPTFLWDNGEILNRRTRTWRLKGLTEALREAAGITPAPESL